VAESPLNEHPVEETDMAKRSDRRKARTQAKGVRTGEIDVSEEQRRRLAECCAYFMAARYRPARPGGYRAQDLIEAGARIDAIVKKHQPN